MDEDSCRLVTINVTDVDVYDTRESYMTCSVIAVNGTFTFYKYDGLNYIRGSPQTSDLFIFNSHLNAINDAFFLCNHTCTH